MGEEEGLGELSQAGDAASALGLPAERSRRPPEQSPAGKSCQDSKQDGKQHITVTTHCVKLGKCPWEGEVVSPSLLEHSESPPRNSRHPRGEAEEPLGVCSLQVSPNSISCCWFWAAEFGGICR